MTNKFFTINHPRYRQDFSHTIFYYIIYIVVLYSTRRLKTLSQLSSFFSLTDNERKRFRRPISSQKTPVSENNIPDEKTELETLPTVNRFKYHRKPSNKNKVSISVNGSDLETAASVNRPTVLHRHIAGKPDNASDNDQESSGSNVKVTRLHSRRGSKPNHEVAQDGDQETASSINRNNIQRRISKPSQGNSLIESESVSDQENLSTTNRLKIRRRISKPENLNSATDETKSDDQDSSLSSRFKVRQKLTSTASSSSSSSSLADSSDGYKVSLAS